MDHLQEDRHQWLRHYGTYPFNLIIRAVDCRIAENIPDLQSSAIQRHVWGPGLYYMYILYMYVNGMPQAV